MKSNSVASLLFLTLTKLYLVDFKADSSVACGPLRLDGEAWRRIFELDAEHRVGSRVRVLDLHVQVGQGGPIGHILRDGDLVMRFCSKRLHQQGISSVTWYSCWLNVGGSSLTSLIVIVMSAVDRVESSRPRKGQNLKTSER